MLTLDNGTTVDMAGDARYVVRDPNGELAGVFRQADRAFLAAQRIDVVVSRRADMRGVEDEASRRLADGRAAYDAQYGDAERALVALLSPIQAATFRKHGLIPLSVIRAELESRRMGTIEAEEMSALIRSGTWDVDLDNARHGSSRTMAEWERSSVPGPRTGASVKRHAPKPPAVVDPDNPTRDERIALTRYELRMESWKRRRGPRAAGTGPRYVRVPWVVTVAEWADRLDAYMHDVAEEATHSPASIDERWTPTVAL